MKPSELSKDLNKCIEEVIEDYIQGLANDYGYCSCKRKHKDMHMDICNDLERIKPLMIKELKRKILTLLKSRIKGDRK